MRYLGNKLRLLNTIYSLVEANNLQDENFTFCDAFSGTGVVGEFFKDRFRIIANDNQYYSFVLSHARLNTPDMQFTLLGIDPFEYFNQDNLTYKGFISENYSPAGDSERMYFSEENALRIDFIRTTIEVWFAKGKVTENEYFYLLASLLESVSKVANIAGVYGSYLKTWDPRAVKRMKFIRVEQLEKESRFESEVHNRTIESLIDDISGDILYLDPPYTKNQYSVQYHLLETIARYDNPDISGKGGLRNTRETSSAFSKSGEAEVEFERIIAKANFKHIFLSYSADGLMSAQFIENVLKRYGKVGTFKVVKIPYARYKNHQTNISKDHFEYLFYVEKKEIDEITFASPLNYQGGKHDLIHFIKSNLPKDPIIRFVDAFGGGYNVGVNVNAEQIIYNEFNHKVVELMETFKATETSEFVRYILNMRRRYKLERGNKEAYVKLRDAYNAKPIDKRDPKMLYMLVLYGFNQQIRFNSSYDYNNPVGQAGLNERMLEKLISFCRRIQLQNILFLSQDFSKLEKYITSDTFVYCDPPYLMTLGSYNDGKRGFNGWEMEDELRLYSFLDKLSKRGTKFMLSNILEHNGQKNITLEEWAAAHNYKIVSNPIPSRKGRKEVLIVNY